MKIEKNSFFFSSLAKENVFEKEKEIYFFFHLEEEKRGKKEEKSALVNKNWTQKIKKLDKHKGYLFHDPLDNEAPAM